MLPFIRPDEMTTQIIIAVDKGKHTYVKIVINGFLELFFPVAVLPIVFCHR